MELLKTLGTYKTTEYVMNRGVFDLVQLALENDLIIRAVKAVRAMGLMNLMETKKLVDAITNDEVIVGDHAVTILVKESMTL